MALRRFYIGSEALQNNELLVTGDLLHHIRDVCRFSLGDRFEVLKGDGDAHLVEITALDSRSLQARVQSVRKLPPLRKPLITLALSVPKLPKVDWIVEKCVELGVYEIRPFVSEYSFLRKVSELSQNRRSRWQKLALSATQQAGRGEVMQITEPTTLENCLNEFNRQPSTGGLFPYEGQAQRGLVQEVARLKSQALDHLWLFVGSEGGFSLGEVERFAKAGLEPVSLGDQILRVETACLALVSIIKYEIGQNVEST